MNLNIQAVRPFRSLRLLSACRARMRRSFCVANRHGPQSFNKIRSWLRVFIHSHDRLWIGARRSLQTACEFLPLSKYLHLSWAIYAGRSPYTR